MTAPPFHTEGRVAVEGGTIWYGVAGCPLGQGGPPLIVVHGGPGMSHDYLINLTDLGTGRPVIFYDQLDAGQSDRPNRPENWHLPRYLGELAHLRRALDLQDVVVFGNSWGGTIAAAYAATQPDGLAGVILSSPLLHTDTWLADNGAYRAALPADVRETMDRCEATGETETPAYLEAVDQFYERHFCRSTPWPAALTRTLEGINAPCYEGMWGPNEFTCTGVLQGYDGTPGLPLITAPCLVTCGRHDEATPDSTEAFAARIPHSRFEVFEDASHTAFIETRAAYMARLQDFLDSLIR